MIDTRTILSKPDGAMTVSPSSSDTWMRRYDYERGVLVLHHPPAEPVPCADLDAVLATLGGRIPADDTFVVTTALYTLALVARRHDDWPTESQRASLIVAVARLRSAFPPLPDLTHSLDEVLPLLDAALLRGENAERTLIKFVESRYGQ